MTQEPDRPFDQRNLDEAAGIALTYHYRLERADGDWYGCTAEMPLVMDDDAEIGECARKTIDATVIAIATLLELKEPVPEPIVETGEQE